MAEKAITERNQCRDLRAGLPDSTYTYISKIPILVYFEGSWSGTRWFKWNILWTFGIPILWPIGILYGHVVILWSFSPFWYIVPRKIWLPCLRGKARKKNKCD
jgi:hypothetical protein